MRMRGFVSGGCLAVALAGPAVAQSGVGIGAKGGVSFGNISNKGLLPGNLDTRTGGAGGVYLHAGTGIVGFGIEALYAQRGAKSDQSLATSETKLDYIDVPAYLRVAIPAPGVKPFAYAGPQISFEVRCKTAGDSDCATSSDRKKTDFAGVIGAGVRFGGALGISLEGRYVYGLRNLDLSTVTSSESYKNRTFMILLGIGR
jgi:hypothetical protein